LSDDFESTIRGLLERHERREAERKKRLEQQRAEGKDFLEAFEQLCRNVISPVLDQAATLLEQHGHVVQVSTPDTSRVTDTELRFSIILRDWKTERSPDSEVPFLRFIAHPMLKLVTVDTSLATAEHPDAVGPRETVQLESITTKTVQSHVTDLLELILGEQEGPRMPRRAQQGIRGEAPGQLTPPTAWTVPRRSPSSTRQ